MPSSQQSQLMSTIIDDEELIDELRRYGEKNLPTLNTAATSGATSRRKTSSSSSSSTANMQLTDQNREILLKKLNHFRAREKVETNPSKQYLKQNSLRKSIEAKRISNIYRQYDETDEVPDDDIIEIDSKNTTSEYVQVNNANTSPLSNSDYPDMHSNDDYCSSTILSSTTNNMHTASQYRGSQQRQPLYSSGQPAASQLNGYVRLKDRIEIDKTLSKYRSEIHSILNDSITRNRNADSVASKLYNLNSNKKPETTKTLHCPRPETKPVSLFGSIKSKLFNTKPVEISSTQRDLNSGSSGSSEEPYDMLKQIRGGRSLHRNAEINNHEHLNTNIRKSSDENFLTNISSFISNVGLQISKLLPYLVFLIFALIIIMYLRMKMNSNTEPESINIGKITLFEENKSDQSIRNSYCADVRDTKCSGTKDLLKELINYLRTKSGAIECSYMYNSEVKPNVINEHPVDFIEKCVHLNKVIDYLMNDLNMIKNKEDKNDAVNSMLKAVLKNPHWEIRLLNESYDDAFDPNQVTYLMSTISAKSFMCRFKELAHFIWVRVIMFTSIIVTFISGYFVYSRIKLMNTERDKEYYDLITKVTGMVEQQYELSLIDPTNMKPFIAISHIYDHLFDPSQRASKKKLWNKVIEFIQNHESRIHLETQFINGEETNVWRWIVAKHDLALKFSNQNEGIGLANSTMLPANDMAMKPNNRIFPNMASSNLTQDSSNTANSSEHNSIQTNGWQGDAFNRTDKLAHSPTPCLKIRNMFDTSSIENDPLMAIRIHNDILERCSSLHTVPVILHISCDKKSKEGCVYIKCNSNDSSGIVYQIMNGTWYNGKLLNVKFLRSDRYMERFPESINYNQQLKPIII